MTLPFSDKPEKSSIYQDVKTETLQELTPDQFDAFKARMFAEGVNGFPHRSEVLLTDRHHGILEDMQPLIRNGSGHVSRLNDNIGCRVSLIIENDIFGGLHQLGEKMIGSMEF